MKSITTIFGLIILLVGETVTAGVVELKEKIEIGHNQIFLKDLATFKGIDGDLLKKLEDLKIGTSPLPGKSRPITLTYIQARIATLGKEGNTLEVLGPKGVEVLRSFQRLEPELVKEQAHQFLLSKLESEKDQFKIKCTFSPKELILPTGSAETRIVEVDSSSLRGPVYIETRILIDGKDHARVKTGFNIQRFQKAITTTKTLSRGQVITPEDLKEEMVDVTRFIRHQPLLDRESIIGKRTKRVIKEGTVLLAEMVEEIPLVKRGSIVTIRGEIGNIHVAILGKALQDGYKDESIRVRNLSSKGTIEAIVKDSRLVVAISE
ncbi:TPA: flagella basal body P-ring formation protein FlgA [bacterium]|nr:flagella basal body P-ring formation protein FlgA [bacterium]